jgi:hypothetical protein
MSNAAESCHEDSRDAAADELGSLVFVHARSHNHDLAAESLLSRQGHEFSAIALAEVEVQQHDVNRCFSQRFKTFFDGVAVRGDAEIWLCGQETRHALAEQGMVIHQQNRSFLFGWIRH